MNIKELREITINSDSYLKEKYDNCWKAILKAAGKGEFQCEIEMWPQEHSAADHKLRQLLELEGLRLSDRGRIGTSDKRKYIIYWL